MATYSKFEIFAALQAAVIYLTMRLVDGCNRSDQDPIYNTEILWAYKHFWKQYILVTASEHCGGTKALSISGWEEWVLEESRIRYL
ncbi:hypothetical protein C8035_v005749 [Colletotrichum spinosum]|uniref:Uncharacterized protein n=1 Tax=Colletotrichum spinosum TaxID=1347390 RepID=A0A4R8QR99_9PEZI|nr:hypothetical protein C8035_v005749 [Colletotrichum spinosum]